MMKALTWTNRVNELNSRLESGDLPVRVVNFTSVWTILYTRPGRCNWMFQYYLRAEGLSLSWIGSGRIIMSHNFSDADYDAIMQRFVAAAQAMQNDGWWWQQTGLTDKSIKKQVFREILTSRF